jgi:Polyketide cyclase / dehydrase and lipid transport
VATAYYSVVLDHPADAVWAHIRSFGAYAWSGVAGETVIEDGKSGDQVGAIRRVATSAGEIRQRLMAFSDRRRSYSYDFVGPASIPVSDYQATIRVVPVVEGDRAFVEWWATFDCTAEDVPRWRNHLVHEGFAKWLSALRAQMASRRTDRAPT